jgi:hypothetical protein
MNSMNIDTHQHRETLLPAMIDHRHDVPDLSKIPTKRRGGGDTNERHLIGQNNLLGNCLAPILKQANGVLSSLPQSTLHDRLQPVVNALKNLDAELLLDLEITTDDRGPRVMEG